MRDSRTESFFRIICLPSQQIVQARPGQKILEALLGADIEIHHSCGGNGSCGTCRILVEEGLESFPKRTDLEVEIAMDRQFTKQERLSCQCEVSANMKIKIP